MNPNAETRIIMCVRNVGGYDEYAVIHKNACVYYGNWHSSAPSEAAQGISSMLELHPLSYEAALKIVNECQVPPPPPSKISGWVCDLPDANIVHAYRRHGQDIR